ncbi:MAG: hypothetical protein DVB23_000393 [Verrucomicrobia bacterium]|jgi:hypothetical protein|nr:MAG: hypothetical protein DVB23_000393 [Verrucomicrobiota bacterium]
MALFGFKEWKMVCDVIGRGEQSLILRKGGISEGKLGFQWLHDAFFLFPTHFHGQVAQLRPGSVEEDEPLPDREPDVVSIRLFAEIVETRLLTDLDAALALEPLHVWNREVVEERFHWGDAPGLSLAVIRAWRLASPWELPQRASFGGCRSWLGLPTAEGLPPDWRETMTPVLPKARVREVRDAIRALTGSALS